jgi:hypothetical protein
MDRALVDLVRSRAGGRCEYCRFPRPPFHIEHIIARKHGGPTIESNLALACVRCNFHKGPNLSGIDSQSRQIVRVFHPRSDSWEDHFQWDGPRLLGRTPIGRATIAVLEINQAMRIEARKRLIVDGEF